MNKLIYFLLLNSIFCSCSKECDTSINDDISKIFIGRWEYIIFLTQSSNFTLGYIGMFDISKTTMKDSIYEFPSSTRTGSWQFNKAKDSLFLSLIGQPNILYEVSLKINAYSGHSFELEGVAYKRFNIPNSTNFDTCYYVYYLNK